MSDPIIKVAEGKLRGQIRKTDKDVKFYSFKGIPYAKPPLGDLRFSVPQPCEKWDEIKDATKDSNPSPQYDCRSEYYIGDEDCLYLNVFTPKLPTANNESRLLPVMVYIHGGGFVYGHGTDETALGPDYLIEKDVVLVTINYRLGILGFLSLNLKDAPGNMGLRDQVLALKWVKANIHNFYGDPDNVTVFGLSAGGASVEYLLLTPLARGLFHKAIAQCGSSICHWAQYSKVKQLAYKAAALDGQTIVDDEELLSYLKTLDVKKISILAMKVVACDKFRGAFHFGFVPVIEQPNDWEPFLDKNTYDMLKNGEFTNVPFMAGFATHEGLLTFSLGKQIFDKIVNTKNLVQALPFQLSAEQEFMVENRLQQTYLGSGTPTNDSVDYAIDYFTDVSILGGVYTATSFIAKKNKSPVFFYEFSYDGNLNHIKHALNITHKGVCHGDEIGYLMKIDILTKSPTDTDLTVRERMVTMWTNFAKYGNPTPETDNLIYTKWEPATAEKLPCLLISDELTMKDEVYPERMHLYKEFYEKYPCSNLL